LAAVVRWGGVTTTARILCPNAGSAVGLGYGCGAAEARVRVPGVRRRWLKRQGLGDFGRACPGLTRRNPGEDRGRLAGAVEHGRGGRRQSLRVGPAVQREGADLRAGECTGTLSGGVFLSATGERTLRAGERVRWRKGR
jgi:hypothetical protein